MRFCARPSDLLYNGGIGTYVRAADETDAEVGDHANDACRITAAELRAKIVVEGGNLGFTQQARIEYALAGGRINTDAIDNSAGVDMSDHEVNLKILLDPAVARGALTFDERNRTLAGMRRRGRANAFCATIATRRCRCQPRTNPQPHPRRCISRPSAGDRGTRPVAPA